MLRNICGILLGILLLTSCGQMGSLYLPPPTPAKNANQTHLDKEIQES